MVWHKSNHGSHVGHRHKGEHAKIYNNNMSAMLTFGKVIDFPGNMSKFTMHYDRGRMIRLGASMKILDYIL